MQYLKTSHDVKAKAFTRSKLQVTCYPRISSSRYSLKQSYAGVIQVYVHIMRILVGRQIYWRQVSWLTRAITLVGVDQ